MTKDKKETQPMQETTGPAKLSEDDRQRLYIRLLKSTNAQQAILTIAEKIQSLKGELSWRETEQQYLVRDAQKLQNDFLEDFNAVREAMGVPQTQQYQLETGEPIIEAPQQPAQLPPVRAKVKQQA